MDSNSTPQTVAQAVQAATQQQQQQISQPSPPVQHLQGAATSTIDNLTCQWQNCGERTDTPEALYDHVCERHVGRKSTNNLNLTCQWGACRTTTVKRDHITSHIRVHVPLKPHKCDFCGKAFKRPQDLKKHVKTHADDSVLMSSPSQGGGNRPSMGGGGMGQQSGEHAYPGTYPLPDSNRPDAFALAASGYYPAQHDTAMSNPYPAYQPNMNAQNGGAYPIPTNNGQYSGYGSVNYPTNSATADIQSMDTRRRAIEALNDFLGDIKRRAINPRQYYDVGSRLQTTALPLPIGSGYNTGYNNSGGYTNANYNAASLLESFNNGSVGGGGGMQVASHGYSLPIPNARTKNDLQDIDRFLEDLQATVYETSSQSAAAGVQQPEVHAMHTGDYNFGGSHPYSQRASNSPPNYTSGGGNMGGVAISSVQNMPGLTAPSNDTPALTPAASVSSYASSGQSPMSTHSRSSLGGNNVSYPIMPSVTGMSDLGAGYPTTTSAPASGLASNFDGLDGRRYSGGRLQRQAPGQDTEMMDADDGLRTPKAADGKLRPKSKGNSSIDPALRGEDEKSSDSASTPAGVSSDGIDDKRQEEWVENIRVIEALKKWVADRLKNGQYEEDDGSNDVNEGADRTTEIAKMVEEKMADDISYPALPSA